MTVADCIRVSLLIIFKIDPDTKTSANTSYQERVAMYATPDGEAAKSVVLSGYLYSPLRQFQGLLPSNVPMIFSFLKADDNRKLFYHF